MHFHLEVIIPPGYDPQTAVAQILAPFEEGTDDEDRSSFWDWYVIGGRWSGHKAELGLGAERLDAFREWLKSERVMVKGVQCGKADLADADTIAKVDAKWREMFPEAGPHCTLFGHSKSSDGALAGDICRVSALPEGLTAARVIVAGPAWGEPGKLVAAHMRSDSIWNGVVHEDTNWDGLVKSAIAEHNKRVDNYRPEAQEGRRVADDWIAITVDYHS